MKHMRILVLRPGAIGDTLLTFPILQHLQRKYEQAEITFVGNVSVLPLAKAFGLAQTIADYEEPQWGQFFVPLTSPPSKQAARLQERVQEVDMAIFWLRNPGAVLMQNAQNLGIKQIFVAPSRPPEDKPMHIVDYLGESIGEHLQMENIWRVPELYAWKPSATDSRAVAIHPGSGGAQKCWPVTSFATLIERLWQHEIPILLLGGPADSERLSELYKQLPTPPRATLLHTLIDAPLLTVARQLQECCGYIGNDSGITHLAALLGVPTLALFGPSSPTIWRPLGSNVALLYEPLLANLSVDMVQSHALSFLREGPTPIASTF